jgi:uncharacterized protein (DUF2062 family)
MKQRLRRLVPSAESLRDSRWLRWLGPLLHRPQLWRISRRGVAVGMALGVFFGLLIPLAQMPFAAVAAVAMRANVPVAVASTLVTNPVTFGPVYYAAWRLGSAVLGEPADDGAEREMTTAGLPATEEGSESFMQRLHRVGKPLLLGLAILASVFGVVTYLVVSWLWHLKVVLARRTRQRRRHNAGRSTR